MARKVIKKVDIVSGDDTVDLKSKERGLGGFRINKIHEDSGVKIGGDHENFIKNSVLEDEKILEVEKGVVVEHGVSADSITTKDLIKVKFEKFVQLIASKDFWEVIEKNKDEDIILSSNLLTELAGAVEEKSESKFPIVFLVGLAIGIVLTYVMISK